MLKKLTLYILIFSMLANHVVPSVAKATEENAMSQIQPQKKSLERQINQAIFWYSQFKKIEKESVSPQVTQFFTVFLTHIQENASAKSTLEADLESESRHKEILRLYDTVIQQAGTDEPSKRKELLALGHALQDPDSEEDDKARLRLFSKYRRITNTHYAEVATMEAAKISANKPSGFKVNWEEVLKAIGTYSIYGLSMVTTTYLVKTELHVYPFFSEIIMIQIAIFAMAAGPFGFFHQLYLQAWDKMKTGIQKMSEKRAERKKAIILKCSKLF